MNQKKFDSNLDLNQIQTILSEISDKKKWSSKKLIKILNKHPRNGNSIYSRDQLIEGYYQLINDKKLSKNSLLLERLRLKPIRTSSGVAPLTVLTKPAPCPGKCIFCPNDIRMPKSYLASEPGAQRASKNNFDPYLQAFNRLKAFKSTGHSIDKIELIVLGGTWSFYPEAYRIWFVKRLFDALNDFPNFNEKENIVKENIYETTHKSTNQINYNAQVHKKNLTDASQKFETATWKELESSQQKNETSDSRCVGLVLETRPDYIDQKEVKTLRRLGATKVQIGIQSLDDNVLKLNKRGHSVSKVKKALKLLRSAGFKIHAHWMPNLYGSSVQSDIKDYINLWKEDFSPDELKIYPTSIIANTELEDLYKKGSYRPYTYNELLELLTTIMPLTPRYCRLTRVIRDIPATDIVAGNKKSNFRQIAEQKLLLDNIKCNCIRCREVRNKKVDFLSLKLKEFRYETANGSEVFLEYVTKDDRIAGFLRLMLPKQLKNKIFKELNDSAIIREVHVYGPVVEINSKSTTNKTQHLGIGTNLVKNAEKIALANNFKNIAVISAIGTKNYYKKLGFLNAGLYMRKTLVNSTL